MFTSVMLKKKKSLERLVVNNSIHKGFTVIDKINKANSRV